MTRSFVLKGEYILASIADRVWALIEDAVRSQGVELWDVRFVKEGASYYLRIFIDSEKGINIDDCTNVSHAVDHILDETDPIDKSYYLEVCSPGLERELTRDEHFAKMQGKRVTVKLYRAVNGAKEITGILKKYENGNLTLDVNSQEMTYSKADISKIHLADL